MMEERERRRRELEEVYLQKKMVSSERCCISWIMDDSQWTNASLIRCVLLVDSA